MTYTCTECGAIKDVGTDILTIGTTCECGGHSFYIHVKDTHVEDFIIGKGRLVLEADCITTRWGDVRGAGNVHVPVTSVVEMLRELSRPDKPIATCWCTSSPLFGGGKLHERACLRAKALWDKLAEAGLTGDPRVVVHGTGRTQ